MGDDRHQMDADTLDEVDRLLKMLQGGRHASALEALEDTDVRKAVFRAGEARGARVIRRVLDEYREDGELPAFTEKELWQHYERMAEALDEADDAVRDDEDDAHPPGPGVQ